MFFILSKIIKILLKCYCGGIKIFFRRFEGGVLKKVILYSTYRRNWGLLIN